MTSAFCVTTCSFFGGAAASAFYTLSLHDALPILDASAITASTVTLAPSSGGNPVAATVAYDGPTQMATLTPSAALAAGTAYTATVAATVKSSGGTALASAVTWGFTTAAAGAPTVNGMVPAAGATGVAAT